MNKYNIQLSAEEVRLLARTNHSTALKVIDSFLENAVSPPTTPIIGVKSQFNTEQLQMLVRVVKDVLGSNVGYPKIFCIKFLRSITDMGLADAKTFVENIIRF